MTRSTNFTLNTGDTLYLACQAETTLYLEDNVANTLDIADKVEANTKYSVGGDE
jgi:hypothetical protein